MCGTEGGVCGTEGGVAGTFSPEELIITYLVRCIGDICKPVVKMVLFKLSQVHLTIRCQST